MPVLTSWLLTTCLHQRCQTKFDALECSAVMLRVASAALIGSMQTLFHRMLYKLPWNPFLTFAFVFCLFWLTLSEFPLVQQKKTRMSNIIYNVTTIFITVFSHNFKPLQTTSDHFKPLQTASNHFNQPLQTISGPKCSVHQPLQATSTHFKRYVGCSKGFHHYLYNACGRIDLAILERCAAPMRRCPADADHP